MNILQEADKIINGPRRQSYGPVSESFKRLSLAFTAVLLHKLKEPVTEPEAILILEMLKVCREAHAHHRDNGVDGCGYWALLDKWHEENPIESLMDSEAIHRLGDN
jgi:hypothetical protein